MSTETTFDLARLPWPCRQKIKETISREEYYMQQDMLEWAERYKGKAPSETYTKLKNYHQAQKDLLLILEALSKD